ncbi:keratin, type I cytoskeletal 10 isoform X1 [Bombyx mori]
MYRLPPLIIDDSYIMTKKHLIPTGKTRAKLQINMDWKTAVLLFAIIYYADGYSKYGRTCRDIGCLNSEVCVLAEDPCTFGHTSNCGTYPTCKKKSLVEGSHAAEPTQPKPMAPKPQTPTLDFDSPPNYKPPVPPSNGVSFGGNSPYDGTSSHGGSPYGGSSGGGSPYGGSTGGGSPYGGSTGGGSPYGGSNPYGGNQYPGGSSGGHNPYGGNNNYGGSSSYGGNSPHGGNSHYGGGNSPYASNSHGGSNPYAPSTGGSGGKSPLDNIFNTLTNYAGGIGGGTPGSSGGGGGGLGNIFGNLLTNLSKNGLSGFVNTRPIMENPNYSSYSSNSRSSNPQTYPSGYQQNHAQDQNKNYRQTYAQHNWATTRKPVSYGWTVSVTVVLTYLIHQYVQNIIRT